MNKEIKTRIYNLINETREKLDNIEFWITHEDVVEQDGMKERHQENSKGSD